MIWACITSWMADGNHAALVEADTESEARQLGAEILKRNEYLNERTRTGGFRYSLKDESQPDPSRWEIVTVEQVPIPCVVDWTGCQPAQDSQP